MQIVNVIGRQILDSRGHPTVEADVILEDGTEGRAAVPSGASTGANEAHELRDNDKSMHHGKGVINAISNINTEIRDAILGMDVKEQEKIDRDLIKLDGTPNKNRLGANAILAVSLSVAKAAALNNRQPFFKYIHTLSGTSKKMSLPVPMMNIINGGRHAHGSTDIQEFMIMPIGANSFSKALRMGTEVFHHLAKVLHNKGYATTVGDEGGFAPNVKNGNAEAIELIIEAINMSGYKTGTDIVLALDVAASEMYQDELYYLKTENRSLTRIEMVDWLTTLTQKYPIVSIEDALDQSDWETWELLNKKIGNKVQLVGDDLFVTNTTFLERGIKNESANAILIKLNQIGTLTETLNAIKMADKAGWNSIISHRSGETEDTTIAHLAVGTGVGQIKTGSLSRTDRVAKYNELLRIEEILGDDAKYVGSGILLK